MLWSQEDKLKVAELIKDIRTIMINEGMKVLPITQVKYLRTDKVYGRCKKHLINNTAIISISAMCLENDKVLINTIIHELCHAMPDTKNHDRRWQEYAKQAGKIFNMEISAEGTEEESKAVVSYKEKYKGTLQIKYIIECKCCHQQWQKKRRSKLIRGIQYNPQNYRCPYCHNSDFDIKNIS